MRVNSFKQNIPDNSRQRIGRFDTREIKQRLPLFSILKKSIFSSHALIPENEKSRINKIFSVTYGQLFGTVLSVSSIADGIHKFFRSPESSVFSKYVIPSIGTMFGLLGIKASTPIKDAFSASLTNSGFSGVIKKIREMIKENNFFDAVKELFLNENDTVLREKIDLSLKAVMPLVKETIEGYRDNYLDVDVSRLIEQICEMEEPNLNSLKGILDEDGIQNLGRFICGNSDFLPELVNHVIGVKGNTKLKVASDDRSEVADSLHDLLNAFNEIISPSGLHFFISQNNKSLNIYISTTDSYKHKGESVKYKPFILLPIRVEYIHEIFDSLRLHMIKINEMNHVIESLKERIESQGASSDPQEIKNRLDEAYENLKVKHNIFLNILFSLFNSGVSDTERNERIGYFVLNADDEPVQEYLINKTPNQLVSDGYIPYDEIQALRDEIRNGPYRIKVRDNISDQKVEDAERSPVKGELQGSASDLVSTSDEDISLSDTLETAKKNLNFFLSDVRITFDGNEDLNIRTVKSFLVKGSVGNYVARQNIGGDAKIKLYEKIVSNLQAEEPNLVQNVQFETVCSKVEHFLKVAGIDISDIPKEGISLDQKSSLENLYRFFNPTEKSKIQKQIDNAILLERAKIILIGQTNPRITSKADALRYLINFGEGKAIEAKKIVDQWEEVNLRTLESTNKS